MRFRKKWISLLFSSLLLYVASFLALRYGVIVWYESMNPLESHWLRPAYEPFFYPLRWLDANGWSLLPHAPHRVAGTVLEVSPSRLVLNTEDGYTKYIGFACQPSSCPLLDGIVKGAKIEATFGAKLVGGGDEFVNELLHVRVGEAERRASEFEPAPCVGTTSALFLLLQPGKDTAPWPQEGVFAGYYRNGFEISDFRPAGTNERWWLSGGGNPHSLLNCHRTNPCYLVVRGQLSGLGPRGHLDAYKRELRVTEVIEQRPLHLDEKVAF
jgi:hypothetical protein